MADLGIQKDFIEGVYEIFYTLFTDGKNDGVNYYAYVEDPLDIYKENKRRKFKAPVLLVAKVQLTPEKGGTDIEMMKDASFITIPLKAFTDNNVDITSNGREQMRKGYLEYKGIFYEIISIRPQAFVEDSFLMYTFTCLEDVEMESAIITTSVIAEGGGLSIAENANDR